MKCRGSPNDAHARGRIFNHTPSHSAVKIIPPINKLNYFYMYHTVNFDKHQSRSLKSTVLVSID